jgi:hypothetical protein
MMRLVIFTALFHVLLFADGSCDQAKLQAFIVRGFQEFGGVLEFLQSVDSDNYKTLKHHENINVSVYVAWMQCRQMAIRDGDVNSKSYRKEFLGFLTAKLGMELPVWWREEIESIDYSGPIARRTLPSPKHSEGFEETDGIRHSSSIEVLELTPDAIRIFDGERTFRADTSGRFFKDRFMCELPTVFAVDRTADGKTVFATADFSDNELILYCSDCDGEKLWSSSVNHLSQVVVGNAMPGPSTLAIHSNGRTVAVFWVTDLAINLDVFEVSTGKVMMRFTTFFEIPKK